MRKYIFVSLAVLWMIGIFSFSAQTAEESTETSHSVGMAIGHFFIKGFDELPEDKKIEYADCIEFPVRKSAHVLEYTFLAILVTGAVYDTLTWDRKKFLLCLAICVLYACSDEIHQIFVPGRAGRIMDVCIDSTGNLIGIAVMQKFMWIMEDILSRRKEKF